MTIQTVSSTQAITPTHVIERDEEPQNVSLFSLARRIMDILARLSLKGYERDMQTKQMYLLQEKQKFDLQLSCINNPVIPLLNTALVGTNILNGICGARQHQNPSPMVVATGAFSQGANVGLEGITSYQRNKYDLYNKSYEFQANSFKTLMNQSYEDAKKADTNYDRALQNEDEVNRLAREQSKSAMGA